MREFSGKTAVITGGASGIGHGVASRLAEAGMNLRFYVLPHPHFGGQIIARAKQIAAGGSVMTWEI